MEELLNRAASLVAYAGVYKYLALFLLSIPEGPVLTVISGFFSRIGLFSWFPAFTVLLLGDLAGDVFWYYLGRHGADPVIRRFGGIFNITQESLEQANRIFHDHSRKILFISKATMGFGFALATLIAAGAAKIPFGRFMAMNFLGGIVWTGMLFGLGYFFGNIYYQVAKEFRIMALVASTVTISVAAYGFSSAMRKRFTQR